MTARSSARVSIAGLSSPPACPPERSEPPPSRWPRAVAAATTAQVALQTQRQYASAVHLFSHDPDWTPPVLTCSALEGTGLEEIWEMAQHYVEGARASGRFEGRRTDQQLHWFRSLTSAMLEATLDQDEAVRQVRTELEAQVRAGELSPYLAAARVVGMLRNR